MSENVNKDTDEPKEESEDYENEFDSYGDMDKKDIPFHEKQLGTEEFKKANYLKASKHYSKALLGYQFLLKDRILTDRETLLKFKTELQIPTNLNLAQCYIKLQQYQSALPFVNTALALDSKNLKGLFRRGLCYLRIGEYQKARQDLVEAKSLDKENEEIDRLIKEIEIQKKREKMKYKEFSQKMMSGLDYSDQIQQQNGKQNKFSFIKLIKQLWYKITCRKQKME